MPSRKIHRAAGISAVLFVILFVATGLLLQHAPSLHLHRHHIPASWAYAFYDAQVLGSTDYRTANHWVSQAGHSLYIDAAPVAETELHRLLGAVETADGIWVAADDRLLLLSKQGQVLESLSLLQGLPETAMRLGIAEGALVLGGAHSIWRASASALQWHPLPPSTAVTWSQAASGEGLPIELQRSVLAHASAHLITWERLLADMHSGRLFGAVGVWLADLAAVLLLLLAATGAVLWFKGGHSGRKGD